LYYFVEDLKQTEDAIGSSSHVFYVSYNPTLLLNIYSLLSILLLLTIYCSIYTVYCLYLSVTCRWKLNISIWHACLRSWVIDSRPLDIDSLLSWAGASTPLRLWSMLPPLPPNFAKKNSIAVYKSVQIEIKNQKCLINYDLMTHYRTFYYLEMFFHPQLCFTNVVTKAGAETVIRICMLIIFL